MQNLRNLFFTVKEGGGLVLRVSCKGLLASTQYESKMLRDRKTISTDHANCITRNNKIINAENSVNTNNTEQNVKSRLDAML